MRFPPAPPAPKVETRDRIPVSRVVASVDEQPRGGSLVERLIPVVDCARQIATTLGTRPRRVWLVHALWSGDRRGMGTPSYTVREILPTPDVGGAPDLTSYVEGNTEMGSVIVSQISATLTEDDLTGKTPDLVSPEDSRSLRDRAEFFWLIANKRASNPRPVMRRYSLGGIPEPGSFGWTATLIRQEDVIGREFEHIRHVVGL